MRRSKSNVHVYIIGISVIMIFGYILFNKLTGIIGGAVYQGTCALGDSGCTCAYVEVPYTGAGQGTYYCAPQTTYPNLPQMVSDAVGYPVGIAGTNYWCLNTHGYMWSGTSSYEAGTFYCPADPYQPQTNCGDGACNGGETAPTCPIDCAPPPPPPPPSEFCGNGFCGSAETSQNCPADCGSPPPICPNGNCEATESSATCPADCGSPPTCPNSICDPFSESTYSCPADCGSVPPPTGYCGDGICNDWESGNSCNDCGTIPPQGDHPGCWNAPLDWGACMSSPAPYYCPIKCGAILAGGPGDAGDDVYT